MKELNLNTILVAVALGVLGWIALSTQRTASDVAQIKEALMNQEFYVHDHEARLRELEKAYARDVTVR